MKPATAVSPKLWQFQSVTVIVTLGDGPGAGVFAAMSARVAWSPPSLKKITCSSSIDAIAALTGVGEGLRPRLQQVADARVRCRSGRGG